MDSIPATDETCLISSRVYIKTNDSGCITDCNGGYTASEISNLEEWTLLDEGVGDRYNLCKSNYFTGGLYTEDGIPKWKYADGLCSLRTDAEMEADRAAIPEPDPTAQDDADAMLVDHEYRLTMLELGLTE